MRGLRLALQFLTILPVRVGGTVEPVHLRRSLAWFPFVGLLIGGTLGLFHAQGRLETLLLVVAWVLLTGGLHLDGLADVADALCARKDRSGRLAVMKDPRVGAAGAAAICLALLLRWECLAGLEGKGLLKALLLVPVLGRSAMVLALRLLPAARPDGLAALWGPAPRIATLLSLAVMGGLSVLFLGLGPGLRICFVSLLAVLALLWIASRAFGGLTGDVCGAAGELAELAALGALRCL